MRKQIESEIERHLDHHKQHITLIDVYLSDLNAGRAGPDDKRCLMEARPRGQRPMAVEHRASSAHLAFVGAIEKLKMSLNHFYDKLGDHRKITPLSDLPGQV
jgi:ribosome-associated translation inhibitor RaiA